MAQNSLWPEIVYGESGRSNMMKMNGAKSERSKVDGFGSKWMVFVWKVDF